MSITPILSLKDVDKNFGGLTAVDSLDLQVLPGQICGLIGPNGWREVVDRLVPPAVRAKLKERFGDG